MEELLQGVFYNNWKYIYKIKFRITKHQEHIIFKKFSLCDVLA